MYATALWQGNFPLKVFINPVLNCLGTEVERLRSVLSGQFSLIRIAEDILDLLCHFTWTKYLFGTFWSRYLFPKVRLLL